MSVNKPRLPLQTLSESQICGMMSTKGRYLATILLASLLCYQQSKRRSIYHHLLLEDVYLANLICTLKEPTLTLKVQAPYGIFRSRLALAAKTAKYSI